MLSSSSHEPAVWEAVKQQQRRSISRRAFKVEVGIGAAGGEKSFLKREGGRRRRHGGLEVGGEEKA